MTEGVQPVVSVATVVYATAARAKKNKNKHTNTTHARTKKTAYVERGMENKKRKKKSVHIILFISYVCINQHRTKINQHGIVCAIVVAGPYDIYILETYILDEAFHCYSLVFHHRRPQTFHLTHLLVCANL